MGGGGGGTCRLPAPELPGVAQSMQKLVSVAGLVGSMRELGRDPRTQGKNVAKTNQIVWRKNISNQSALTIRPAIHILQSVILGQKKPNRLAKNTFLIIRSGNCQRIHAACSSLHHCSWLHQPHRHGSNAATPATPKSAFMHHELGVRAQGEPAGDGQLGLGLLAVALGHSRRRPATCRPPSGWGRPGRAGPSSRSAWRRHQPSAAVQRTAAAMRPAPAGAVRSRPGARLGGARRRAHPRWLSPPQPLRR